MRVNRSGFTLIELLVVMLIIMVLGTIAVISFTGAQASARDTRRMADLGEYQKALEFYSIKNNYFYPSSYSTTSAYSLCGQLDLENCSRDPKYPSTDDYRYRSDANITFPLSISASRYVLWAKLERSNEYYVVCSSGEKGKAPVSGFSASSGDCPI